MDPQIALINADYQEIGLEAILSLQLSKFIHPRIQSLAPFLLLCAIITLLDTFG